MTPEHVNKVLKDIQSRIPPDLLKYVAHEKKATPTVELVVQKALEDPSISEEKKVQLRALVDAGEFSKMRVIENPKIAKMINEFVQREIRKEVKKGNLPTKAQFRKNPALLKYYEKTFAQKD